MLWGVLWRGRFLIASLDKRVWGEEGILALWINLVPCCLTLRLECKNNLRDLDSQKPLEGDESGTEWPVVLGRSEPAVTSLQLERSLAAAHPLLVKLTQLK